MFAPFFQVQLLSVSAGVSVSLLGVYGRRQYHLAEQISRTELECGAAGYTFLLIKGA